MVIPIKSIQIVSSRKNIVQLLETNRNMQKLAKIVSLFSFEKLTVIFLHNTEHRKEKNAEFVVWVWSPAISRSTT